MTTADERTRTYSWQDPREQFAAMAGKTGLEAMRSWLEGGAAAPPIGKTMAFQMLEADEGRVVFGVEWAEWMSNPIGSIHGGVYATLLDSACACAVHTTLPAGDGYTSLDLTVKFLRPLTPQSGLARCEGTVTHRGRRTALAEARMTDAQGKLLAMATSSCLILPA